MQQAKHVSPLSVIIAFAIVYLVWGSTYFFIRVAIQHMPALILAFLRFTIAGMLLMIWCILRGEKIFVWQQVKPALISGMFLLVLGNGAVVWSEKFLPSSFAAVIASASPIWMVLLDGRNSRANFRSRETLAGLLIGFVGVVLMFSESAKTAFGPQRDNWQTIALIVLVIGSMSWAGGSLYAKYNSTGNSQTVNSAWQMLAAGLAFIPISAVSGEWNNFSWSSVTTGSWLSLGYLVFFGSLAGYSAYVWLLQVRPATQVSTHAYVNPVVAVILGVLIGGEKMTNLQFIGLAVILTSVLLINISKYRKSRPAIPVMKKMACEG